MEYVLFRRVKKTDPSCFIFSFGHIDGEEWNKTGKAVPEEILEFVGKVTSLKAVAALVRRDPLHPYVLFEGKMTEIKVAIPVFMNGKSLDTMGAEWDKP